MNFSKHLRIECVKMPVRPFAHIPQCSVIGATLTESQVVTEVEVPVYRHQIKLHYGICAKGLLKT